MATTEQHYSLRWNDYTVKIVTAFQSLRDEEDFVDVTVACDGHHYSAHKIVLSACSPYFRSLLRANPCQHPIVILKDVGHVEMERLLEFMYNGEVNIAQDQLAAFLKTAENLKIRGLAGSSEDIEQNKDGLHSFSNTIGANNNGGTSPEKNSPIQGFSGIMTKEEENHLDSNITYSRIESPPSKRRKRSNGPATSHADTNTQSQVPDGLVSDGVELENAGVLTMEDDMRLLDRREMKPEPIDPMTEVYAEAELSDVHQAGDQLDQRPVMYPLAMAGPSSGNTAVTSQENMNSQEAGVGGSTFCEALNLSLRPTSSIPQTNGILLPSSTSLQHNQRLQPQVAATVISHGNALFQSTDEGDRKPQEFIGFVYNPNVRFAPKVSPAEKISSIEIIEQGTVSNNNQILDNVVLSTAPSQEFKHNKSYPCPECHKVFRHPMSLHHHRHVHKGTYTCDSCGKVFSRRWDLHRHTHRSKMGCRRPTNNNNTSNGIPTTMTVAPHCEDFKFDLNNSPSN